MLRAKPVEPSFYVPPVAEGPAAPRRGSNSSSSKATAATTGTTATSTATSPVAKIANRTAHPPKPRQRPPQQDENASPMKQSRQQRPQRPPPASPGNQPQRSPRPRGNSSLRRSASFQNVHRPEPPAPLTSPRARARGLLRRAASLPRMIQNKTGARLPFMDDSSRDNFNNNASHRRTSLGTYDDSVEFKGQQGFRHFGQKVQQGLGKGTSKATKVTKQAYMETATAAIIGAKLTAKGTVRATRNLAKGTARMGKGIEDAVTDQVAHLVALNRERRLDDQVIAAWNTRLTSPMTHVDLQLSCRDLKPKDSFAQADAFAVIWSVPCGYGILTNQYGKLLQPAQCSIPSLPTSQEREVGRTEVVRGCRNPQFNATFQIQYQFELEQTYVVRVYDEDMRFASDLKEHDYLGGAVFTMGQLMGMGRRILVRPLDGRDNNNYKWNYQNRRSKLVIRAQERLENREVLEFRFSAQDLKEQEKTKVADVIYKVNPYFKIMRFDKEEQEWTCVYKSEALRNNSSPTWALSRIPLSVLCHDDINAPIKITLWDYKTRNESQTLGFVDTTVSKLVEDAAVGIPVLPVWKEKKKVLGLGLGRNKFTKNKQCIVKILRAALKPLPTMLDYSTGGCELDLIMAVDCSMSNGDASQGDGGHYRPKLWLNDYQSAIHKVGVLVEPYSRRNQFTMWGFGGTVDFDEVPYFPMGGGHGVVAGTTGMLDAYDDLFDKNPINVEPTERASICPVIQAAVYRAIKKSETEHCYSVLCIVTAGNLADDLRETVDAICTAADDAPLSIVIIGVGAESNFDSIKPLVLSADGRSILRSKMGVPIARNIVQFACFSDVNDTASAVVASALKEIPEQLVEYFAICGVDPFPPVPVEEDDLTSDRSDTSGHSAPDELLDHHRLSVVGGHDSMPTIGDKKRKKKKVRKRPVAKNEPRSNPSMRKNGRPVSRNI